MSEKNKNLIENPHSLQASQILKDLNVNPESGLSKSEVSQRKKKYGKNRLKEVKRKTPLQILINQFKSLIIVILIIASLLAFIFTSWIDGLAIAVAVILNTLIGFFMELKAVRSMEALREMEQITANVFRDGDYEKIHAAELVPGDIVVFESGDIVSADMRLLEVSKLQANESMLTGESMPVSKQTEPAEADSPIADRTNMLFKGTSITRGSGKAVVTATGMHTELGRISSLVEQSGDEFTPLEKRLGQFGKKLIWLTFAVLAIVALLGVLRGKQMLIMIETAVALAVAAIPEGLPIVATIAMARGMMRMARRNALVNKLSAVETLGGTNIIITDKTGTLTENRMTITTLNLPHGNVKIKNDQNGKAVFTLDDRQINPEQDKILQTALKIGVLCNNADLDEKNQPTGIGDPLEAAFLVAGVKADIHRDRLIEKMPEQREEAFDTSTKMMATFNKTDNGCFVAVKGAVEAVLEVCTNIQDKDTQKQLDQDRKQHWNQINEKMAKDGLRVLAVAKKDVESKDVQPYQDLTFIGLIGMLDPLREDVKDAINLCKKAGLKVVMVTGDHPQTAFKIASDLSLNEDNRQNPILGKEIKSPDQLSGQQKENFLKSSIFARVSPEQKLNLVDLHKLNGSTVAMTGDGVNDAPGLEKADIGISMGQRGTQVAREASDMVLKDDSFSTIVEAIKQGRIIFKNIRKFVIYLLSGNVSQIMIVFFATLFNSPLPILPLQILLLNVISDVFPALALGLGEGTDQVMKDPPRDPSEPVLTKKHWLAVFGYGLLIAVTVLTSFALAFTWLDADNATAVTVSFLTLAFARLWHIFNMRDPGTKLNANEIVKNKFVWYALALCTFIQLAVVYTPGINTTLKLTQPTSLQWTMIIIMSLVPLIVTQVYKSFRKNPKTE